MNFIDLVKAHIDGSARPADTKVVFEILDRVLRSNDNGCAEARFLAELDAQNPGSMSTTWPCTALFDYRRVVRALIEKHLVTVARLEAERDAALAARNDLERRNQDLVRRMMEATSRADRAAQAMRDEEARHAAEINGERRRHGETAAALSQAEKRIEELSADVKRLEMAAYGPTTGRGG